MLLVQTTYPLEGYQEFISSIIKKDFVSCIQAYKISSIYFWEGKWQNEEEMLISFKTKKKLFKKLKKEILKNHIYEIPQIIALKAKKVDKNYNKWHKNAIKFK